MRIAGLVIVGLLFSTNSYPATFDSMPLIHASQSVIRQTTTLQSVAKALRPSVDKDLAIYMLDASQFISNELLVLEDLSILLGDMVNQDDKNSVRNLIRRYGDQVVKTCSRNIDVFNNALTKAQSTALVSEGEHLRDDLTRACELVKTWK